MKTTEAKEKICPYALIAYFMPGNIRGEVSPDSRCEANNCMAWRWHHDVDGIENRAVRKENFLGRKGND